MDWCRKVIQANRSRKIKPKSEQEVRNTRRATPGDLGTKQQTLRTTHSSFFFFCASSASSIHLLVTEKSISSCHLKGCLNSQNASGGQSTEEACQRSCEQGSTGVSFKDILNQSQYSACCGREIYFFCTRINNAHLRRLHV